MSEWGGRSKGEVDAERGEEESYNKVPNVSSDSNHVLSAVRRERAGSRRLACISKRPAIREEVNSVQTDSNKDTTESEREIVREILALLEACHELESTPNFSRAELEGTWLDFEVAHRHLREHTRV